MKHKLKETIGVQIAMDNLASIASIDMENLPPLGIVGKSRLVSTEEDLGVDTIEWLSGEGIAPIADVLDLTYRSIHQHLIHLSDSADINWESEKTRLGICSMMDLVGESTQKMDRFFEIRLGKKPAEKMADLEGFKALQSYYRNVFAKKFKGGLEGAEAWSEEWQKNEASTFLDVSHSGLQSFEAVKRDSDYELFYIHDEEGKPYFSPQLLRNIKLSCNFDLESAAFEEDPLLKVRAMQDRDLHATAAKILNECHPVITDYYKVAKKLEGNELSESIGMALIALFVAANPRYLLTNTTGKSCLQYFEDFHRFLRRSMRTSMYQKLIAYPPDQSDRHSHMLLYLVHSLAKSFFERLGGVRLETIGLIHRNMRKGEELKQVENEPRIKPDSIWNQFILDDELYRTLLSKFPNGPIFKILDLIREEEEGGMVPFDPIGQSNLPSRLYEFQRKGKKTEVLRLPSPTRQTLIDKVEIIDEFKGFLRSLSQDSVKQKHMLINLQDRNAWKEYSRSRALETLQLNSEFSHSLIVITLPKHTAFYYQINEYLNLNQADAFLKALQDQLLMPEESGYFFPPQLKTTDLARFAELSLPLIHKHFFHGKNSLTRRNREDFIEIFYQFLTLKCIDVIEPSSVSFTCKDAIDTGASASAMWFGFIKLLSGNFSSRETQDFLRWLLYTPALFVRERAIEHERLTRALSLLERLDGQMRAEGSTILSTFGALYHPHTFKTLDIKH